MTVLSELDAAGRRRSPATLPGYHAGRPPRNKGVRYPADPPTVEEIVAAAVAERARRAAGRAAVLHHRRPDPGAAVVRPRRPPRVPRTRPFAGTRPRASALDQS
jgi:hypothetical protein